MKQNQPIWVTSEYTREELDDHSILLWVASDLPSQLGIPADTTISGIISCLAHDMCTSKAISVSIQPNQQKLSGLSFYLNQNTVNTFQKDGENFEARLLKG